MPKNDTLKEDCIEREEISMIDDRMFRDAMGKFATGITVVTMEQNRDITGMTVNAFMSISLDPKLIAISVGEDASMYSPLQETKKFGVSILREDQEQLSMIFARQIINDQKINYTYQDGVPVIQDTLATISCSVKDMVKAGDHMIFIAEVTDLSINEGKPILYFNGNYQKMNEI